MWKAQLSIFLLVLAVLFAKSLAQWTTVFYDDFSGPSLNATLWNVASNKTHGSQELELYLKDDVYLENGALVLRTQARQAYFGPKLYNFTSGWIDTAGKVELAYGKFEASIKLPDPLKAVWPAYWLVNDNAKCWPVGGEIDILEAVGAFRNDSVFGTLHWGDECGKDQWDGRNGAYPHPAGANFSDAFHVFGLYWNATAITWTVDGNAYVSRTAGQPKTLDVQWGPMYHIFNVAMSYWPTSKTPLPQAGFPTYMIIDWVKAYAWEGDQSGQFPIPFNSTGLGPQ